MSLETRREIISYLVVMDEKELREALEATKKIFERRMTRRRE